MIVTKNLAYFIHTVNMDGMRRVLCQCHDLIDSLMAAGL